MVVFRITKVYHTHTAFSLWTIDLKDYNTLLGDGTAYQISRNAKSARFVCKEIPVSGHFLNCSQKYQKQIKYNLDKLLSKYLSPPPFFFFSFLFERWFWAIWTYKKKS